MRLGWRLAPGATWALAGVLALAACSESVVLRPLDGSPDLTSDANPADAKPDTTNTVRDARVDSPFETDSEGRVLCGSGDPCRCDNGEDDDGDGLSDGNDPECTGPFDDDESSFATGVPGDNVDFCQDCFFDGNSGSGDDDCQYHTNCLYGEAPPDRGDSSCFSCEVSAACVDFCELRTPNGCDCFGCCDVLRADGSTLSIFLAPTCSLGKVDDPDACPRCTPSSDCANDCDRCELCPGRKVSDLPADCGATPQCGGGAPACSENEPCPSPDLYCQQGCCAARLF